jgi:nitroimidazol reductase NimA-like FMN-containing flavoprotein (pyridoxamine 5'-phosphate oxidase superfamily)
VAFQNRFEVALSRCHFADHPGEVSLSPTVRSTVTRLRERARTDRADLYAVLDAGLVGHLGLVRDGAPVVLPTGYGRIDDTVYVHGSTGAGYLRIADGAPVCLTVTHVDGVVYARSAFHHSVNYRSAVVHSTARRVTDPDERWAALAAITEQLAPGSWDHARQPDARELAATAVFALDLAEASVKVRTGPPSDDAEDIAAGGRWAGVLPVRTTFGTPRPCPTLPAGAATPLHVTSRAGRSAHAQRGVSWNRHTVAHPTITDR